MNFYQTFIKPILFRIDPEQAHHLALRAGSFARIPMITKAINRFYDFESTRLSQELFGLTFKNPVGLSAGSDKNCEASEMFAALGFGFLESVSFTYLPQPGNEKPRVFRLPEDNALINRLGFPSIGAEALRSRVAQARKHCNASGRVFAVNFAKSKIVALEDSVSDYLASFRIMREMVDYITINVSSPNTPGLRELQARTYLEEILRAIQSENQKQLPILVKIAPDLTTQQLDQVIETCLDCQVSGIVATNSTIARESIRSPLQTESGGLSGSPLFKRSLPMVRHIYKHAGKRLRIIGVGGISSPEDAIAMLQAGASLIEIYTALIFHGPSLVKDIKRGMVAHLDQVGASHISEIIGSH